MSYFLKKYRHDVIAIGFLGLGLFMSLALASFNPQDPSLNSIGRGVKALNYCGIVGSFIADLLYQALGLAAWIGIAGLFKIALSGFQGESLDFKNIRLIWGIMLVVCVSSLLSLYLPETKMYLNQIYLGGLLGLGLSQVIVKAFNYVGAQVVLWSTMSVLVVFYSDKTLQELLEISKEIISGVQKKNGWLSKVKRSLGELFIKGNKAKKVSFFPLGEENFIENGKQLPLRSQKSKPKAGIEEPSRDDSEEDELNLLDENNDDGEADEDSPEEELEDETPAIKMAKKRKVVIKVKPPSRIANWDMPKLSLLQDPPNSRIKIDKSEISRKAEALIEKLKNFSVDGQIMDAKPGPLVTMYEFKPNADVKISKISELEDDLSLALSSDSVRVVGHIPGTDVVGIETANLKREVVFYKDLIAEPSFWAEDTALPVAVGRQADGKPKVVDLRKMPHLLIAGTTGSGKSVFTGSIITGLMFRHSPKTLRMILIDPKMVDLAPFAEIPHLILPHITEPKKAGSALKWAVREMERRYKSLSKFASPKLEVFNEKVSYLTKDQIEEHQKINTEFEDNRQRSEMYYFQPLPFIVIVIDELADLMIVEKQNIEEPIQRLTQKARACGIHLIIATQSPRKDVVTGLIKTNIPGRVALKVASKTDSRIIIDDSGAERLLPNGDMLFLMPGVSKPVRHHGPFLSDAEIANVCKHWSNQAEPEYDEGGLKALEGPTADGGDSNAGGESFGSEEYDERYDEILAWAGAQKSISASLIQRRFSLGYPRAARLVEVFEREGVVGPANGSKPRAVLVGSFRET